jgi:integrase
LGRVSEINRLVWDDVNFELRYVILYTRKKRGGHLTPRKVPMTNKLHEILSRRYQNRDPAKSWVFWHTFWDIKAGQWKSGPFRDRHKIMKTLCKKAGVKYFRFHPIRHSGAFTMDNSNIPIGTIQRILGHENRSTT